MELFWYYIVVCGKVFGDGKVDLVLVYICNGDGRVFGLVSYGGG